MSLWSLSGRLRPRSRFCGALKHKPISQRVRRHVHHAFRQIIQFRNGIPDRIPAPRKARHLPPSYNALTT